MSKPIYAAAAIALVILIVVAAMNGERLYAAMLRMHGPPKQHHAVASEDWPDTEVGTLARRWTEAFSKGERSMRETLPQIMTARSLAKRNMDSRMEDYRTMRERFGSLMLARIDSSGADGLKVTLAASDLKQYQFIFMADTGPPYRLARISLMDRRSVGHGGGHGR